MGHFKTLMVRQDATAGVDDVGLEPNAVGDGGHPKARVVAVQQPHDLVSLAAAVELDEGVIIRIRNLGYGRHPLLEGDLEVLKNERLIGRPVHLLMQHAEEGGIQDEQA